MEDDEPIVIVEDEPSTSGLLRWVADACCAALTDQSDAAAYLRSVGVGDPALWRSYRFGVGDHALYRDLDDDERQIMCSLGLLAPRGGNCEILAGSGCCLFTYDPRDPHQPVGVIRLAKAQNKHSFATAPAGLGCAADIDQHQRIVVVDHPLLMLRLAQAGVAGVALVEDPAVLPPLADWLAEKDLVVVSATNARLEPFRQSLGPAAADAPAITVRGDLASVKPATLRLLGLDPDEFQRPATAPLTDVHLAQLVTFAQERLAAGQGLDLVHELCPHPATLVSTYGLGYLPPDFRSALPQGLRRALRGHRIANALIWPASDAQGVVVDLLATKRVGDAWNAVSLLPEPRGLIGHRVLRACDDITITDTVRELGHLHGEGREAVVLLRDAADAAQNVGRFVDAGLRRVRMQCVYRQGAGIAEAIRQAGLPLADEAAMPAVVPQSVPADDASVKEGEPAVAQVAAVSIAPGPAAASCPAPAPASPSLDLLTHDQAAGLATFSWNEATLVAEVPWDHSTRLEVSLRHRGQTHRDRFDLAAAPARARFASGAAMRSGLDAVAIEAVLVELLDRIRALVEQDDAPAAPAITISQEDQDEAMTRLRRPDLLATILQDLNDLGWAGEERTKHLLYLSSISRKLPDPIWSAMRASSGAGKSHGMDLIAACTPAEDLLQVSRLTDSALYYQDPQALRHKLLVVDEADALKPDVVVALRVLQTRGALSLSHVQRNMATGKSKAQCIEVRGPVALMTSTAAGLDEQLLSRCFDLSVDESPEQTARILVAQRQLRARIGFQGTGGERKRILHRHHTLQRLLACRPVVIPFAERIAFPAVSVRHRREQERFLGLIEASALLHQFQRMSDGAAIIADEQDFQLAAALMNGLLAEATPGMSKHAQQLLQLCYAKKLTAFTMDDLTALAPDWTRYAFRAALKELMELDYISSPRGGRGRRREYTLLGNAGTPSRDSTRIRLLTNEEVGELAAVGETAFTNLTVEPKHA